MRVTTLPIEGGFKPLTGLGKNREKTFFQKMASRSDVQDDDDDLFSHVMSITKKLHKPMQTYIDSILNGGDVAIDLDGKNKELNKLLIFLAVNYDAPFNVKKRVVDAAFMSSILYGCESWLNISLKPVEKMYHSAIKAVLGVRVTTPTDLCVIEGGFKPLTGLVKNRQKTFFEKMASRSDVQDDDDDPFSHVMSITKELHKPMQTYIDSIVNGGDVAKEELERIKLSVTNATGTKFRTYMSLNPELSVHNLYSSKAPTIPDYLRITFSRFRLSSHRLRVEMGRWSRTPPLERLCSCGQGIQDEHHIFVCPHVKGMFDSLPKACSSPVELFTDTSIDELHILHQVLKELSDQTNVNVNES